jgi:hypothetical protein
MEVAIAKFARQWFLLQGHNCWYTMQYILAELLNLGNLAVQIMAMNLFLQNNFLHLGLHFTENINLNEFSRHV